MNAAILAVSWFLSKTLNVGIVLLALAEIGFMIRAYKKMAMLKGRIDKLNSTSIGSQILTYKKDGNLKTESVLISEKSWTEFDQFCDEYQNNSILFSVVSLIIQIFPLLGILGTVTGLYVAMNGNADWSEAQSLFEGVKFALSSTVLGILFAVIFKFADIVLSAMFLNYIDDGISRFRENYNVEKELPAGGEAE